MVSATQQSSRIRKRKQSSEGTANKRARRAKGTPAFAVHPEGYDAAAADAQKPAKAKKVTRIRKVKKAKAAPAKKPASK